MKLQWRPDPKQANKRVATSAAYHYVILLRTDNQAEMFVRHRGDRPSAQPIKSFPYKNHKAALGGAQRFEDKHGFADPAHHAPAEVAPFLAPLPKSVRDVLDDAAAAVRSAALTSRVMDTAQADDRLTMCELRYVELCASLLCCSRYGCYARTEVYEPMCTAHRAVSESTED